MSHAPLNTYLRMYRRRTGLSQDDVAYLLGVVSGTNLSRHEVGGRIPLLGTALAYEIIFRTSIRDLYEGEVRRLEEDILLRAQGLCALLQRNPKTTERERKLAFLRDLVGKDEDIRAR